LFAALSLSINYFVFIAIIPIIAVFLISAYKYVYTEFEKINIIKKENNK